MISDGWTAMPSFCGLVGNPRLKNLAAEEMAAYTAALHELDFPRQEAIRARVDAIVTDKVTAEDLKPWYPGWCKRPCFHDDYQASFNLPHVHLVHTDGRGVDAIAKTGIVYGGKTYDVDLFIFSTGFEPWGAGSPAYRAGLKITGRHGLDMETKWQENWGTLHGLFTRDFPNLVLSGGTQAAPAANQVHMIDVYASHVARVIQQAVKKTEGKRSVVLEPSAEGEAEWTRAIMSHAHGLVTLLKCTPSYVTAERNFSKPASIEDQLRSARRAPWTPGLLDYCDTIDAWAASGDLRGFDIQVRAS